MKLILLYQFLFLVVLIRCEKVPEVGGAFTIQPDGSDYYVLTDTLNNLVISGHILKATSDEIFILLYQNPVDSICECNYECFVKMPTYDKKSYKRCNKGFEESTIRKYWIIDKTKVSVYNRETRTRSNVSGPYSEDQYLKKRIELGVPSDLQLVVDDDLLEY